jgi:hypothetical protein
MNEVTTPGSVNEPQTRDTLLEQLNFLIDGARSNLMDMKASLAIDGPMLKPEPQYTKERLAKMLRDAYDLGATAHEENMTVDGGRYGSIEAHVEVEEGGFSYSGDANVDSDVIKECISFDEHNMTDEQVDEILKA